MLTNGKLIELALGREEAKHVDTAIPQHVFDRQYAGQREQNAGWYYDRDQFTGARGLMGRLLTQGECRDRILGRLSNGELVARLGEQDLPAFICREWRCFWDHVERGEITLEDA